MSKDRDLKVWGDFLVHDRLDPGYMGNKLDVVKLLNLISRLATDHPEPHPFRSYKERLLCRERVCMTAFDLGIDLTAMKSKKGKTLMGRGLLDAWNKAYKKRFGSTVGTASEQEINRRGISTRLADRRKTERFRE